MGKSSQRKGADGERELTALLQREGYPVRRTPSESYGAAPDIVCLPGIHVEVKRVERLNISEAMNQAVRDSKKFADGFPTVFHRRNREPWLVTMRFADWLKIYESGVYKNG